MKIPTKLLQADFLPLLVLAGMVLWFNYELLGGSQLPFFRDLAPFFYPMRFSLMQAFRGWELPLWDRHMAMGFPLLANLQSETFYLPNLCLVFLPFIPAMQAIFILHYLVAATGSYKLLRQWNCLPSLSLIGATLFAFGGVTVSLSNLLNHFQAAVWLPWLLLWWERWLCRGSRTSLLATTFLSLTQFLAGSPEVYGMSLGLLALDGLRLKGGGEAIPYRRLLVRLFVTQALVAGLAAIQILPTMELFLESRGRNPVSLAEGLRWSLQPLALFNLFFPDKEVDLNRLDGLRLVFISEVPLILSLYLGAVSLFGVCLWLVRAGGRELTATLALLALSIICALGGNTPVYPFLFSRLPFLELVRFPEKYLFVSYVLLLFMAVRGLSLFFQPDRPLLKREAFVLLAVPLLFAGVYGLFRYERASLLQFVASKDALSEFQDYTLRSFSLLLSNLERQIALTVALATLLYLGKKRRLRESLVQFLLAALVFADLASAHRPFHYLLDGRLIDQTPKVLQPSGNYRLMYIPGPGHLHPDYYPSSKKSFGEGIASLFANLSPNSGLFYGFDYLQELDPFRRWRYDLLVQKGVTLPPEKLYRLLGALNVKFITSYETLPPASGLRLMREFPEYGSFLYELSKVVPRVYVAAQASQGASGGEILERLSSDSFDPLTSVILDRPLSLPRHKDFAGRAEILSYGNSVVTIQTSLNGYGILVLADALYPGWRVYVDGEESEMLRANLFFRAVRLAPGEHRVVFRYEPRSFLAGLFLSLATLAGLIVWLLRGAAHKHEA